MKIKKNDFIVSCQALPNEPLHSSFIMGKMALAAYQGGANGIRANGVDDILEIRKNVNLPIIGIIKKDFENSNVYITPTLDEVTELANIGVEVIAVDATKRFRPDGNTLEEFFKMCKEKFPNQLFMADCSTIEEMINAEKLGFDYIGTTLFGYTDYSNTLALGEKKFLFDEIMSIIKKPVIAEGNIMTPEEAKMVKDSGVFAIVVGGAITRPQQITQRFVKKLI